MSASTPTLPRWRAVCSYDGTDFSGWQSQPDGNAIQDHLERRLAEVLGAKLRVHGSGRTDAGVHAIGQVFHFDAAWRHGPDKLRAALASGLPEAIQIRSLHRAPPDFHARFSAAGKVYFYDVHTGRASPFERRYCWPLGRSLDLAAMEEAARHLRGSHDFRAFAALNGPPREDTVRELRRLEVKKRGARVRIEAEADGFLYKMVRSIAGTLVAAGLGNIPPENVAGLLAGRRRTPVVRTAPARGLFLRRVLYQRTGEHCRSAAR